MSLFGFSRSRFWDGTWEILPLRLLDINIYGRKGEKLRLSKGKGRTMMQLNKVPAKVTGSSRANVHQHDLSLGLNSQVLYTHDSLSHWVGTVRGRIWTRLGLLSAAETDLKGADSWRLYADHTPHSCTSQKILEEGPRLCTGEIIF